MCKVALLVFIAAFAFQGSHGDNTSLGKCPTVDPMPGFNMNRLLGYWYAIQKTSTSSPCLSYNITQDGAHEGQYKITETEQHPTLWSSALHHEHHITGKLTVPDSKVPARMALDLPLDIGTTTFTVFMTDYDNYVAIFTCKKLPLIHRWSAEILSRTPTLDMTFVDEVRTRLSSYNIDPFTLSIINQGGCAAPGTKGGIINTAANTWDEINTLVTDNTVVRTASNVANNLGERVISLTADPTPKTSN